jgi:serine phosphatase RsbU (regulator of sigma subunit)/CHASE2 domain-containing sensor protein
MTASKSVSEARPRLRAIRPAGLAGTIIVALLLLVAGEGLSRMMFDTWQRLSPRDLSATNVHVVAIDDESLKEVGPWPWPRYHLARLTEEIGARGATAIGFDMIFPERDSLSPDIFAGMHVETLSAAERARLASLPSWDTVFGAVIGTHPVVLARIGVDEDGVDPGQLASEAVITGEAPSGTAAYSAAKANIAELDDAARGYGLLNGPPDDDGVVRRVPLIARLGRNLAPAIGLEVARVAMGEQGVALSPDHLAVGARRVSMDGEGRMRLRFGSFAPSATTSAIDLMRQGVRSDALSGKAVLIGLTAKGTSDIVSTPLGAESFGVYVQAQAVDALLRGSGWLSRPSRAAAAEWGVGGLLALLAILFLPRLGRAWLIVPAAAAALVGFSWGGFEFWSLLIDPLPSLGLGGGAAAGVGLGMFAEARRERGWLRQQLVEERVAAAATEAELEAARAIQLGMLPPRASLAKLDRRLDLDAVLEPARSVGGDFYDAVRLSPDRIAFTVADVTGKGVPASLFMAVSKALSRSVILRERDLAEAATMLNEELSRDNEESGVTMLLGVIDLASGEVAMVNAGHENPIHLRSDGSADEVRMEGGPPFCIVDYPWPIERVTLGPGDALVLLTDGVTEAEDRDGELYGRARATAAVSGLAEASARELVERVLGSVREHEGGLEASDDLTVMAVRFLA